MEGQVAQEVTLQSRRIRKVTSLGCYLLVLATTTGFPMEQRCEEYLVYLVLQGLVSFCLQVLFLCYVAEPPMCLSVPNPTLPWVNLSHSPTTLVPSLRNAPSPYPSYLNEMRDLDGSGRVWPVTAKLTDLAIRAKLYFSSPLFATGLCSVPPFSTYGCR